MKLFGQLKWMRAYALACWHSIRLGRFQALLRGTAGLIGALRAGPSELANNRTAFCQPCQMFYEPLGTCGEPGHVVDGEPVGCWCVVAIANRHPLKDCWAREHDLDIGWPDTLRPT